MARLTTFEVPEVPDDDTKQPEKGTFTLSEEDLASMKKVAGGEGKTFYHTSC